MSRAKRDQRPKKPFTARLNTDNLEHLHSIAEKEHRTVSNLIDDAVDRWLISQGETTSAETPDGFTLDLDDIKRMTPVVEAMGQSLPLTLFLEIVTTLRPKS